MELQLRRLFVLPCLFVSFATSAVGATLIVDNDFSECPQATFATIQEAVFAAGPGDKILVCPGTYFGSVPVEGKADLRIEAQAGPGDVVLQGTGAPGEFGFHLVDSTRVVLQGFTVQGFGRANIRIDLGGSNTVRKNVARNGLIDGIQVTNSSSNVVEQNTTHGNAVDGIFVGRVIDNFVRLASDNIVRHNEAFRNGQFGINLFGTGTDNLVSGNRSYENRVRGIVNAGLSHGNVIEYNHVFGNGVLPATGMGFGVGINVVNSTNVTVRNNRAERNTTSGFALTNAAGNHFVNNQSDGNGANGVLFNASGGDNVVRNGNTVEKNQISHNVLDGIRLMNNSDGNFVRFNDIRRSGRDGIRVQDVTSENNTIERNVIRESVGDDAHDDSAGAGTGGSANFWIDNHCETDNRPGLCASH